MKQFNAVFEGGGVKGIGLVGALARIQEEGVDLPSVAGTSAGSIVAALYAAGYSVEDLKKTLEETNFGDLLDPGLFNKLRFFRKYGIYQGKKLREWVYSRLQEKGVRTFKDIQGLTGRDLKIIASDVTNREILVFSETNNPTLDVADAVRMSVGIPLFFQAYTFASRLVVDGGLLSNYPVWVFAESELPTLGFKLVSSKSRDMVPAAPDSFRKFVASLVSTMLTAHDKESEKAMGWDSTIHIPTGQIATTEFSLREEDKEFLYNSGYRAASDFIKRAPELFTAAEEPATAKPAAGVIEPGSVYGSLKRMENISQDAIDEIFQVIRVKNKLSVARPDARLEIEEECINQSGEGQVEAVRRLTTDSPTDFRDLEFKAWFITDGNKRKAAVDFDASGDGRSYTVHIKFKGGVVEPMERIDLHRSWKAPSSVARNEDYWVFPLNQYHFEVGTMVVEACFEKEVADLGFFRKTDSGLKPVGIQGPHLENEGNKRVYVYRTTIDHPSGLYLLRWRLE